MRQVLFRFFKQIFTCIANAPSTLMRTQTSIAWLLIILIKPFKDSEIIKMNQLKKAVKRIPDCILIYCKSIHYKSLDFTYSLLAAPTSQILPSQLLPGYCPYLRLQYYVYPFDISIVLLLYHLFLRGFWTLQAAIRRAYQNGSV